MAVWIWESWVEGGAEGGQESKKRKEKNKTKTKKEKKHTASTSIVPPTSNKRHHFITPTLDLICQFIERLMQSTSGVENKIISATLDMGAWG